MRGVSTRYELNDEFEFRFTPLAGGVGGIRLRAKAKLNASEPRCKITNIPCLDTGTPYRVEIWSGKYQTEAFAQMMVPRDQTSEVRILMVNPATVKGIVKPAYDGLPASFRTALDGADIPQQGTKKGAELYAALGDKDCACVLNVFRKAAFGTSTDVLSFVTGIRRLETDRVFVLMNPGIRNVMATGVIPANYVAANNSLHDPMPGYRMVDSYKSADAHANLQVTFMQHTASGTWAADMDIDEAAGFRHRLEALRNTVLQSTTNPYEVHQLLIRYAGDREQDPGYQLVFSD